MSKHIRDVIKHKAAKEYRRAFRSGYNRSDSLNMAFDALFDELASLGFDVPSNLSAFAEQYRAEFVRGLESFRFGLEERMGG